MSAAALCRAEKVGQAEGAAPAALAEAGRPHRALLRACMHEGGFGKVVPARVRCPLHAPVPDPDFTQIEEPLQASVVRLKTRLAQSVHHQNNVKPSQTLVTESL